MHRIRMSMLVAICGAGALLVSCNEDGRSPTNADRTAAGLSPRLDLSGSQLEPFTYRAAIDPYRILQLPSFMMQERARSDIIMQRSVFNPGPGAWHHHAGPSFVYVIQGQIKLVEYSAKTGCSETPVRGPGEVYFEEGGDVHRAVVVSAEPAVLLVTRFDIPPGSPITVPEPAPAC